MNERLSSQFKLLSRQEYCPPPMSLLYPTNLLVTSYKLYKKKVTWCANLLKRSSTYISNLPAMKSSNGSKSSNFHKKINPSLCPLHLQELCGS